MILHKVKKILRRSSTRTNVSYNISEIISTAFGYKIPSDERKGKVKIDVLVQDGESFPKSSAFIRLIAPLTHPLIANQVSLNISGRLHDFRNDTQIIIVQRAVLSSKTESKEIIKLAKSRGITLIVDTDDAFFSLDRTHPNYEELHNRHDALLHLIKNADQLWVSTENLKKYYQKISKIPIHVIANTLDSRIWKKNNIKKIPPKSPLQLLYMGTATHAEDFGMIIPWLDDIYRKYPESFELHIVGISSNLPQKPWLKPIKRGPDTVIYPNFIKWIQSNGPFEVGLAPLVNSTFNKYKSDIKCLDYLAIGAVPMVSEVDPYLNKELKEFILVNENYKKFWFKALERLILDLPGFRQRRLKALKLAQNYIWEKRSSKVAARCIANLLKIDY